MHQIGKEYTFLSSVPSLLVKNGSFYRLFFSSFFPLINNLDFRKYAPDSIIYRDENIVSEGLDTCFSPVHHNFVGKDNFVTFQSCTFSHFSLLTSEI